jgi:hypothetical protein
MSFTDFKSTPFKAAARFNEETVDADSADQDMKALSK